MCLKLVTGRVCLYKNRSLRLGNALPEQQRNVTGKVHSGTTVGVASWESLGSVQEPLGWEGTHFGQGDRAIGQPSWRALLHGSDAAQCSPRREQLPVTSFSLLFFFKAEMSCSSCPGAVCTGDTTFTKQYPLAAVCASVLHFHSLLIPLLSLQMLYPEREDKCVGV